MPQWPQSVPPSPNIMWNHTNSCRTALTNACNKVGLSLRFEAPKDPSTPDHIARFSAICYVNERIYGRASTDYESKKSAIEDCSRQALMQLSEEDPERLLSCRGYLPIFMAYIKQQDIGDRIAFTDTSTGPAHHLTWFSFLQCIAEVDGSVVGEGRAFTKTAAREVAAIAAAQAWGS